MIFVIPVGFLPREEKSLTFRLIHEKTHLENCFAHILMDSFFRSPIFKFGYTIYVSPVCHLSAIPTIHLPQTAVTPSKLDQTSPKSSKNIKNQETWNLPQRDLSLLPLPLFPLVALFPSRAWPAAFWRISQSIIHKALMENNNNNNNNNNKKVCDVYKTLFLWWDFHLPRSTS